MMFRVLLVLLTFGLLVACGGSTGPAPVHLADKDNRRTVMVQRGDSAWLIARRSGVPLRSLIQANGLTPPYTLEVGQRLIVPATRQHRVRSGESISVIAERYQVSRYQLARLNGIGPPYRIYPKQVLKIPQSTVDQQPVRRKVSPKTTARAAAPPLPPKRPRDNPAPRRIAKAPKATAPAPKPASSDLIWPVRGRVISGFGPKPGGLHNDGVNIALAAGAPVVAAGSGSVVYAGNELKGFGNLVLIRHGSGITTAYAHLQDTLVQRGQKVQRGDRIATVGTSGGVAPAQLHFEIRKGRTALNPIKRLGPVPTGKASASLSLAECGRKLRQSPCRT